MIPTTVWFLFLSSLPSIYVQKVSNEKADLSTLRFVHAVWRHGDRTPSRTIPTDQSNTLEKWNAKFGGLSQLTELGVKQQFELGKLLRQRYDGFLPSAYNSQQFTYRSSDYNRTKMSALANIQGMFAAYGASTPMLPLEEYTSKGLMLGALPIGNDPLVFDSVECQRANVFEDWQFNNDKDFKEAEKTNADFLHFVGQKSGFNEQLSLPHINYVHDPLNSIVRHQVDGFQLPDWANASVRAEIFRLYNLKNSFDFKSDLQKRLWAGPLYTEILEQMKKFVAADSRMDVIKEKFHAYSGHDTTVAGILSIFGIFPAVYPTFASAVLIELHINGMDNNNNESSAFVRLFYKNETNAPTIWEYTPIPNCGSPCRLEELELSRRRYLIDLDQWHQECGIDKGDDPSSGQQSTTMSSHISMLAPLLLISFMLLVPDLAHPFFGYGFFAYPSFGFGHPHSSIGWHHGGGGGGGGYGGGHHGHGGGYAGHGHANVSANPNATNIAPSTTTTITSGGNSTSVV